MIKSFKRVKYKACDIYYRSHVETNNCSFAAGFVLNNMNVAQLALWTSYLVHSVQESRARVTQMNLVCINNVSMSF